MTAPSCAIARWTVVGALDARHRSMSGTSTPEGEVHDEHALVEQLLNGDDRAYAELIRRHDAHLVHLARLFVHDEETAREVAQDAWVGVLAGLPRFERRSSLKTWITRIVVNIAKTRGVREKRIVSVPGLDDRPAHEATPEAQLIDREELQIVARALASLPASQAAAVMLHDVEGLDSEEVSQVLGVSQSNLRVLHH